ncbi:MAG: MerR family transcriptional regulator [Gammaproteobacteria bacterium]
MSNARIKNPMFLRIGEVTERTGVSTKALRLYEKRGLLNPAMHSAAGYRLYDRDSLHRLMQIVLLKRGGFSLAEIGVLLARDSDAGTRVLANRIVALEREVSVKTQSLDALRTMAERLGSAVFIDVNELTRAIRMNTHLDLKLTDTERKTMRERAEELGEQGMAKAQQAWTDLIEEVRAAMEAGMPPDDPTVRNLGKRWHELTEVSTGGNPEVGRKIANAYMEQPAVMMAQGMDRAMFRYVEQAMQAAGMSFGR